MAAYVVIRVLGQADVNYNIQHTMHLLGLNRVNHATVVPVNDAYKGMLQVVKDYCGSEKKAMTALTEDELNVVFDWFTQKNAVADFAAYFAVRDHAIEKQQISAVHYYCTVYVNMLKSDKSKTEEFLIYRIF